MELIDEISNIIEECKMTLSEIERVLYTSRYKLTNKHLSIFSVQSISMVYSIWEGTVHRILSSYIKYINTENLKIEDLSDDIMIFFMEKSFKQLYEYPVKKGKKIKLYENLDKHYRERRIELPNVVDTGSNLGFEELNNLMLTFSLTTFSEHWNEYTHPSPNLRDMLTTFLRYRNGVAHGGDISSEEKVTIDVYIKYKILVVNLLYELLDKISIAIIEKTYRKTVV